MTANDEPGITMHLVCCEAVILNEIEQGLNQRQIAQTYGMAIHANKVHGEPVDWKVINEAIVKRWSVKGLERIKNMAWSGKCFERKERS